MLKTRSLWGICFLGISYLVFVCSVSTVTRKALRGTNVTFRCPFPFTFNLSNIIAYWWKDGNKSFLQQDDRKVFILKRAGAYLHLLNVTVPDAGTYYCAVKYKSQMAGKGAVVRLIIYASPVPLKIVSIPCEGTASVFLRLQCRTAEFHPKDFNLTWHKNGTEITEGFTTEQQEKAEGLYEVISSFEETRPIEQGTVYTCQVYHVSILDPANGSYTVGNVGCHFVLPVHLIYRTAVGILVIITLMVIIFDHITSDNPHRCRGEETRKNDVKGRKVELGGEMASGEYECHDFKNTIH
ncbi:hypothetical protein scyTo_0012035 [Scyliorhinus torazame]|uniref:Ig-like domain-containing protein n=1 Tax=Scyliorhinus torazame TaxID=75743 RepID=A0A401P0D4_SCYTO|nr:hypothetical protein [Scyliorhinus torazame]